MSELPVVVIGAGPLGLAAAAQLLERGLAPMVLEAGHGTGVGGRAVGTRPHLLAVARTHRPGRRPAPGPDGLDGEGVGFPDRPGVDRRLPGTAGRRPG
nr:FAD-dependent monooxygenase [Mycobacterium gordonae]